MPEMRTGNKALKAETFFEGLTDERRRLEEFRNGVIRLLKDLDSSECELDETNRKLKETQAQLIQTSKLTALGELAAGLAHELNQPLTVIKGLSQSILARLGPEDADYEKIKLIVDASRNMELIIRHLRIFSRSGADEPSMRPVDFNSVIKDAFLLMRELLHSRSIEIKTDLKPIPPVLGDVTRLEQVVINIIANAKDAMPGGGVFSVSTGTADEGGRRLVKASFADTGPGIPAAVIGRVFDPFFTTKEPGKGTGLGLSISYGIIKEHSGGITVENRSPNGAVFHVKLPAIE